MTGNRVQVGFFSMSGRSATGDDAAYLRWHLLDHMPEQYRLPGLVQAQRWFADDACVDARPVVEDPLGEVRNVVCYLMGRPVRETLGDFAALGGQLARMGRFGERLPSLLLGPHRLVHAFASPRIQVDAVVVPFRPHQGVCVIVEEPVAGGDLPGWLRWLHADHHAVLAGVEGCAGGWVFAVAASDDTSPWAPAERIVTVLYLDGEPVETSRLLEPHLQRRWDTSVRPCLVTPLRSMLAWEPWLGDEPVGA